MRNAIAILGGLGIGAALMYLFDPQGGNRRRALIRDKATKMNRLTRETVSGRAGDISNKAKGLIHDAKSAFTRETGTTPEHGTFGDQTVRG